MLHRAIDAKGRGLLLRPLYGVDVAFAISRMWRLLAIAAAFPRHNEIMEFTPGTKGYRK
jgi:hypothetical protein